MNRGETLMTGRTDNSSGRPKSGKSGLACEQVYGLKEPQSLVVAINLRRKPYSASATQLQEIKSQSLGSLPHKAPPLLKSTKSTCLDSKAITLQENTWVPVAHAPTCLQSACEPVVVSSRSGTRIGTSNAQPLPIHQTRDASHNQRT